MEKKKQWKILNNIHNTFISHKQPVSLAQFVTQRCNARCPHCFVDFKTAENELTLEQIEKITKTTGNCLRNVALTGGEPFIRDDFFEIANIWYKNTPIKSIVVTSNGSMPDRIENFCKKAQKNNLPVTFFFSYDFIGEQHSEYRRLKDLHINVLESNKIVQNFNFNSTLNITVSGNNYESAFETYEYMRDNIKAQNINCTIVRGENAESLDNETRKKLANVYEQIQMQKDKDFDKCLIKGFKDNSLTSVLINAKNKLLWKYILETFNENKYISPCAAGSLFGIIYHDGSVFPCELRNNEIGKLKDYDYNFMKLWESQIAKQLKKEILCTKCRCTDECSWLVSIFSSPRYYGELSYNIVKNLMRTKNE